jgi:hypothetical protein
LHEGHGVVVARHAVTVNDAALFAAVDQHPFAVLAQGNGDRLHFAAAAGGAVAGNVVEVDAPEAVWAVIAVPGARGGDGKGATAVAAAKKVCHRIELERVCVEGKSRSRTGRGSAWTLHALPPPQNPHEKRCVAAGFLHKIRETIQHEGLMLDERRLRDKTVCRFKGRLLSYNVFQKSTEQETRFLSTD